MFKHLQHVDLEFRPWDNPYYTDKIPYDHLVDQFITYAHKLQIDVNKIRCLDRDDAYFNELHKIYEHNYDGNPDWLDYHENIHLCQRYFYKSKNLVANLDWREKAGLLYKDFDTDWCRLSTMKLKPGDVYVQWNELGKTPYQYWLEKEPNDPDRIKQLVKPWSDLKPKMTVAMQDIDLLDRPNIQDFMDWWSNYENEWCQQHNLQNWSIDQMGVIVVYQIDDFEKLDLALQQQNNPKKISL